MLEQISKLPRYAGMNVSKSILVVMGISGGLAGLAGGVPCHRCTTLFD